MPQNTEIERKFLVTSNAFMAEATQKHEIEQGYLCKEKDRTIRVRICDERAFLTIKSSTLREGIARFEWEKEIDVGDARELLQLCLPGVINKTRYVIKANALRAGKEAKGEGSADIKGERKWEVDVFHDRLDGLVLAELELDDENEAFDKPAWLGEEVTGDPRYYNANM